MSLSTVQDLNKDKTGLPPADNIPTTSTSSAPAAAIPSGALNDAATVAITAAVVANAVTRNAARSWASNTGDVFDVDIKALHAIFDFVDKSPSDDQSEATASHIMAAFAHFASSALQQVETPLENGNRLLWEDVSPVEAKALVCAAELAAEKGNGARRVSWLPEYATALVATEHLSSGRINIYIIGLDNWRIEELRDG